MAHIASRQPVVAAEIGSAVSNQAFTIPNTATWTNIPAVQAMVYAGIPWTCRISAGLSIVTNGTPASTAIAVQLRVVDAASSSIVYGFLSWQGLFSAASFTYVDEKTAVQLNDPLAADTVVKLQGIGTSNVNYTYSTSVPTATAGGVTMQALRRS